MNINYGLSIMDYQLSKERKIGIDTTLKQCIQWTLMVIFGFAYLSSTVIELQTIEYHNLHIT